MNGIDVIKVMDCFLGFAKTAREGKQREFWIVWILCRGGKVLPLWVCSTKEIIGIKTKRWYIDGRALNNFWQVGTNTKRHVYRWLVSHLDYQIRNCFYDRRSLQRNVQKVQVTQPITTEDNTSDFGFTTGDYQPNINNKLAFLLHFAPSDRLDDKKKDSSLRIWIWRKKSNSLRKIFLARKGGFYNSNEGKKNSCASNTGIQGVLEDFLYNPETPYYLYKESNTQKWPLWERIISMRKETR